MKYNQPLVLVSLFFFCTCRWCLASTCDFNGDGTSNVMDLQMLVNGILASSTSNSLDINQDGKVDVLDLQRLANVILGIQSCPGQGGVSPQIEGVEIFPPDNPWNRDISTDPVDPNSANYMTNMNGGTRYLHADFGSNPDYGIPFVVVPGTQPRVPVVFDYADESDPGPYPIPSNAPIEGGASSSGDRHVLVLDKDNHKLYETFSSYYVGPEWHCGSGAIFDLTSNSLRPDYWTSADAAGLPILPGLVRYDEAVVAGEIRHAVRFTVARTQKAFIHPATHYASSSTDPNLPPMGLRVRLNANYDLTHFTGAAHAILVALKKYGMLLADNGSDWYITGASDPRWDDNDLNQLKTVPASAFEVVQSGPIHK